MTEAMTGAAPAGTAPAGIGETSRGRTSGRRQRDRDKQKTSAPHYITRKIPFYEMLSAEGLDKLERQAEWILKEVGIDFRGDAEALRLWRDAGADVRGLHRPAMDWNAAAVADVETTPQGEMFGHLRMLSDILMAVPGMGEAGPARPLAGRDGPILAFARALPKGRFLCLANLSDDSRSVRLLKPATDLFDGLRRGGATQIPPWQVLWLHEV